MQLCSVQQPITLTDSFTGLRPVYLSLSAINSTLEVKVVAVVALALLVEHLDEVVGGVGLFNAQVGKASQGVDVDEVFAGIFHSRRANDELVDLTFVGHLVLRRWEDFVLAEVPFRLAVGFGELALKHHLLVFAFLGELIDEWAREGVWFLRIEIFAKKRIKIMPSQGHGCDAKIKFKNDFL